MGAMSRNKGRSGEQEFARLMRDHLGMDITRNWQGQAAEGGADLAGLEGYAVEVKRAKAYQRDWWHQAVRQACAADSLPVLAYRLDGMGRGLAPEHKWRIELLGSSVIPELLTEHYTITLSAAAWFAVLRERMEEKT